MKPPEMVKITSSNRVKITLSGTGPQEAIDALSRYLDIINPVLANQERGLTVEMVAVYETASLVLDLYEHQVVPQMRLDQAPETLKLSVSRMEGLRLWAMAMTDPAPVDVQMQWLTAINELHQKIT